MQRSTMKSEYELLDLAVSELSSSGAFPLVFGGLSSSNGIHVSTLRGHRTPNLVGLNVEVNRGLGGRSISDRQPRITNNYRTSRVITHDYDRQVLSEGVSTLLAVPVIVDGAVRGVIYGGQRNDVSVGNVSIEPAVRIAAKLQRALAARDDAERVRLQVASHQQRRAVQDAPELDPAQLEQLRTSYAELRSIAAAVENPEIVGRLRVLEQRIAGLVSTEAVCPAEVRLSPRELDVLGYVAVGLRNAEVARELGLTESTVKSYLGAAMQKLGQRSRHGAVVEARRFGFLP